MKYLIINNQIIEEEQAVIPIKERIVRFGDGVFETCRIINQKIQDFDLHLQRLKTSLSELKIAANIYNLEELSYQLIHKNNLKNGFLRISISRGIGSKGYLPSKNCQALIIIENLPYFEQKKQKILLGISKYKKLSSDILLLNAKISNNLISIMAKIEAEERELFDVILLNERDEIAETSSANIFWQKDNQIYTPDIKCGIVAGITREKFMKKNEVTTIQAKIDHLIKADEIFITNINIGILKIDKLIV